MYRKSNTVTSFSDLNKLQGIQEIQCWNQAEEEKAKLAGTPVGDTDGERIWDEKERMWADRQRNTRPVSKEEREYLRSLWGFKRR